ncbi:MAG: hypothetical protein AB7O24_19230 [Kofleriaceae bacterium]
MAARWLRCAVVATVAACSGGSPSTSKTEPSAAPPVTVASAQPVAPVAPVEPTSGSAGSAAAPATPTSEPTPPAGAAGVDFIEDARLLYRIAACGATDQPLPEVLTKGDPKRTEKLAKIVDRHCKRILERVTAFRAQYFERARPWFDAVVPADAPATVVYPFGGGDLLSALVAFPNATEITTISLEMSGDPRRLRTLELPAIDTSLGALRAEIGGLISVGSNTSVNLSAQQRNDLPGQVASFLLGLVTGGFEPVSMRYFKLDDTGQIHYFDQAEIDALDAEGKAKRTSLKHDWEPPTFSHAFANVEIQYRKPGESTLRVHRHFGWNLGDDYMTKNPQLKRHLERKGKVTVLTKGGSYLLWRPDFSLIRNYLLDNLAWMLSDSTGIPPRYARQAGMVQETYGTYSGAFLEGSQESKHDEAFIELWQTQKKRKLPFRFGYVDKDKQAHLVVTRPRTK